MDAPFAGRASRTTTTRFSRGPYGAGLSCTSNWRLSGGRCSAISAASRSAASSSEATVCTSKRYACSRTARPLAVPRAEGTKYEPTRTLRFLDLPT